MKKIISLIFVIVLVAALAVTFVSCGEKETENAGENTNQDIDVIEEIDPEEELVIPMAPGSSYVYSRGSLTLSKDPVIENGMLVLYFNESLEYGEKLECYIGMMGIGEAESVKAIPAVDAYADMALDDGNFCGIALVPETDLTPGNYEFSVSVGTFVVETFSLTVE